MAIIFIPGIKATELVDAYPLDHPPRWPGPDAAPGDMIEVPEDLALIDGKHDRDGHWLQPGRVAHRICGPMVNALRSRFAPEPVHAFGYDWRKPLEVSASRLVDFVDAVCAREQASGRKPALKLVTHSMGGLLLRAALPLRNKRDPFADVARVVFIAPPFRGSIGTAHALVAGETDPWFGTGPAYRKITRGYPSVYQMTPSWPGAATDEAGRDVDLFDPANWQANVVRGNQFRADFLRNAEAFVRGRKTRHDGHSHAPMLGDASLAKAADKFLVICGSGLPTPRTLPVLKHNPANPCWFDFADMTLDERGDGRVPMCSAAVKGVTLAAFADSGMHALLCRDERVIELTRLWLQGRKALRLAPRRSSAPMQRRARYFRPWDGNPDSLEKHIA